MNKNKKTSELRRVDEWYDGPQLRRSYEVGFSAVHDVIDNPSAYFPGFGKTLPTGTYKRGRVVRLTAPTEIDGQEHLTSYTMTLPGFIQKAVGRVVGRDPKVSIKGVMSLPPTRTSEQLKGQKR